MAEIPTTLPTSYSLRARWLFPGQGSPADNPTVTVRDGHIASLAPAESVAPVIDLGDAAILPGLVNAHTHLELGPLADLLPTAQPFTEWVLELMKQHNLPPAEIVSNPDALHELFIKSISAEHG